MPDTEPDYSRVEARILAWLAALGSYSILPIEEKIDRFVFSYTGRVDKKANTTACMPDTETETQAIARRMRELGLVRDTPFNQKPEADYKKDLEDKIKSDMGKVNDMGKNGKDTSATPIEQPFTGGHVGGYYG